MGGGLSCDSDGRRKVGVEEEGGSEEGVAAVAAIVSAIPLVCLIESNDVCPTRRTCGHCGDIELGERGSDKCVCRGVTGHGGRRGQPLIGCQWIIDAHNWSNLGITSRSVLT